MELLDSTSTHNKTINFKKEIRKFIKYWPWILLSVIFFYALGYIYLKYKQPLYASKTTLLFPQSNPNKTALNDLKNLGMGISGDDELQGEAAVIVSKPILEKVVTSLNLQTQFFAKGKIREIELYDLSPYIAKLYNVSPDFKGASYYIEPVNKNTYLLSEGPLSSNKNSFRYGELVKLPWGEIIISKNTQGYAPYKNFVVFKSKESVVKELEYAVTSKVSTGLLLDLNYTSATPKRSENILDEVVKQYNQDGINDKNLEALNTQRFIDERLDLITNDLGKVEQDKENFKKANQLTDLDIQANVAVTRLTTNVDNVYTESAQLEIVSALYRKALSGKEQLFPTGLGLNATTEALLNQYNELLLTKKRTQKQASDINPTIKSYDKQLEDLMFSIKNNLQETSAQLQKKVGQTNLLIGEDKASINKYPTQEKVFRNIERQRNLKESIYLYLLQKREENAITLAITTPKAKVVNPAYTTGIVNPNYAQVKAMSIAAGLLLPLLVIFLINMLDTKIRSKEDITAVVNNIPVISEIPHYNDGLPLVQKSDFSIFAESFRILISNIKFIIRSKGITKGGVILVTSSVKGEGKTTVSTNTAISLSGGGKVLIIGADIRNPQLQRYISGRGLGLTDYLISEDTSVDKYIIQTELHPNLSVLFSGTKAPNPNDLLDMSKLDDMITDLRTKYDYIILDSAPIMLVSDSLHLVDIVDLVLYTVKSEFTEKEMLSYAENLKLDHHTQNIAIVLNNVKPEYAKYGYKYGYGYYTDVNEKGFFSRLFKS